MNKIEEKEITKAEYIEFLGTDKPLTATDIYDYLLEAKKIKPETIDKFNPKVGLFNQLIFPCTGTEQIFNAAALLTAENKPIVITDSAIDAMSIEQCGGSAIAIKDRNYKALINTVKAFEAEDKTFIICLKREDAAETEKAEIRIAEKLKELGVYAYRKDLTGDYKSINELLQNDVKRLDSSICCLKTEKDEYLCRNVTGRFDILLNQIKENENKPYISTGFKALDTVIDGGLYPGLHILMAESGFGKTTFAMQMMDNIAEQGRDVLIFSLEMGEAELMARSISRETFKLSGCNNDRRTTKAKTIRGILNGCYYKSYSDAELEIIETAKINYACKGQHIYIFEGVGDYGISRIRNTIRKHIELTGNTPIVLIDYLQIIAPADVRATDKQNTDKAVIELKRISRDYKIPMIVISATNRDYYKGGAKQDIYLSAAKESGAIEYTADMVFGLQMRKASETAKWEYNEDKYEKDLQIKILKARNGISEKAIDLKYYPAYNYFSFDDEDVKAAELVEVDDELPSELEEARPKKRTKFQ